MVLLWGFIPVSAKATEGYYNFSTVKILLKYHFLLIVEKRGICSQNIIHPIIVFLFQYLIE
jgi:hypothetical protein